ncbi:MAG: ATP-binding cassette domain-containing protein [Pseudomonadota bacterium]
MSLVTILNLSLSFMGKTLFENIGFQIDAGDRVGLVGPNGAGKTTLLNLIMGETTPESGEIRIQKGLNIGYLPQDVQETSSEKLLQWVRGLCS